MNTFFPLVLAVSAALAAQGSVVSPAGLATADGNTGNAYPRWGATSPYQPRYMQIHSDLGPNAHVFKELALRFNGGAPAFAGPTVLDAELYMGASVSWDRASWVYANNYIQPPTNVVSRSTLNIQNVGGGSTPNPFDVKFPFTTPFTYVPAFSVAWEIRVYNTSGPVTFGPDAHSATSANTADLSFGSGCTASGQASSMLLVSNSGAFGSAFTLGWYVDFAPASAPTVLAIGTSNPNLTIPGLCGTVYTNLLAIFPMGTTDASGFLGEQFTGGSKGPGGVNALALPNTFPGATFYLQAHSMDPASPNPIKISSSNGRSVTVPSPNLGTVVPATRIYGFDVGSGATNPNAFYVSSSAGYAAVVQFTY